MSDSRNIQEYVTKEIINYLEHDRKNEYFLEFAEQFGLKLDRGLKLKHDYVKCTKCDNYSPLYVERIRYEYCKACDTTICPKCVTTLLNCKICPYITCYNCYNCNICLNMDHSFEPYLL